MAATGPEPTTPLPNTPSQREGAGGGQVFGVPEIGRVSRPVGQPRPTGTPASPRPRRRRKRFLIASALAALLLLVAAECLLRFWLRLGDPPLYMADARCEYRMVPSRSYLRFNARSTYNAYGMRATPDFPERKANPAERRILVFGDSVVNGGPQTDDGFIATRMVAAQLSTLTGRPTIVANISAGGWSPGHMRGYAQAFGLFDSDTVIIVLNNGDAFDHPAHGRPLGRDFPTATPLFALQEVAFRYIPNWLETKLGGAAGTVTDKPEANPQAIEALRDLAALAREKGAKVAALLHPTRSEVLRGPKPGTTALVNELAALGIATVDARPVFANAMEAGIAPYRDDVHPSRDGQGALAGALREAIAAAR